MDLILNWITITTHTKESRPFTLKVEKGVICFLKKLLM